MTHIHRRLYARLGLLALVAGVLTAANIDDLLPPQAPTTCWAADSVSFGHIPERAGVATPASSAC